MVSIFTFIKNGTTNAAQVYGAATGSNLGVLGFEFVIKNDARYVTITWTTEITLAEWFWVCSNLSAAVAGVAVLMKSAGVQANATGGQASFGVPGWNTGAPATLTNSGGTAQIGIIRSGDFSIKSDSRIEYNDGMKFYDRLLVKGTFIFDGVSANDLKAIMGSSLESNTVLALNTYNGDNITLTGFSLNETINIGDSDMGLHIEFEGHAVRNPNDAPVATVTPPFPNIDIGRNAPLTLALNLVNS